MAKKSKDDSTKRAKANHVKGNAGSLYFATNTVRTGRDFADLMSNLMSDLLAERVTPRVGTAVCNAGGKLLKVTELQFKYGTPVAGGKQDISLGFSDIAAKKKEIV